jgi:hypothetical protein
MRQIATVHSGDLSWKFITWAPRVERERIHHIYVQLAFFLRADSPKSTRSMAKRQATPLAIQGASRLAGGQRRDDRDEAGLRSIVGDAA